MKNASRWRIFNWFFLSSAVWVLWVGIRKKNQTRRRQISDVEKCLKNSSAYEKDLNFFFSPNKTFRGKHFPQKRNLHSRWLFSVRVCSWLECDEIYKLSGRFFISQRDCFAYQFSSFLLLCSTFLSSCFISIGLRTFLLCEDILIATHSKVLGWVSKEAALVCNLGEENHQSENLARPSS